MMTPAQLLAARHLANLSQADVAMATGLPLSTIERAESEQDRSVSADEITAIQEMLEGAGVIFVAENGDGRPSVKLSRAKR